MYTGFICSNCSPPQASCLSVPQWMDLIESHLRLCPKPSPLVFPYWNLSSIQVEILLRLLFSYTGLGLWGRRVRWRKLKCFCEQWKSRVLMCVGRLSSLGDIRLWWQVFLICTDKQGPSGGPLRHVGCRICREKGGLSHPIT